MYLGHVQELPGQSACDKLARLPGAVARVQRHALPQQGMHMLAVCTKPDGYTTGCCSVVCSHLHGSLVLEGRQLIGVEALDLRSSAGLTP